MTEPDPDHPTPAERAGPVARAWSHARQAAARVKPDQVAQQFETTAAALVDRAGSRLEGHRGGGVAIATLHQARLGLGWTIRSWNLVILQVPSVLLLAYATYTVRIRAIGMEDVHQASLPRLSLLGLALLLLAVVVLACNTVFAFALVRGRETHLPLASAWTETRARFGRVVVGAFLMTAAVVVLLWLGRQGGRWSITASGIAVVVLLSVALASLPVLLTELPRQRGADGGRAARRQRAERRAVRTSSSALITAPTVVLVELGKVLDRLPGLRWAGVLLIVLGALLHTVARSSVRAIKLTATLVTSADPAREAAEAEALGDLEAGPPADLRPPGEPADRPPG